MNKKITVVTKDAPLPVGPYSQAVKTGNMFFLSGQIALDPKTNNLVTDTIENEIRQIFANMSAVAKANGGTLDHMIKLNIFLTDLGNFQLLNNIMMEYFTEPYPARSTIGVASLPKNVNVEVEGIMVVE